MSPYKDPDEFIKNLGQAAFQERIDHAENSFMFEIRMLERDYDMNDPEEKTNFHNQIARKLHTDGEVPNDSTLYFLNKNILKYRKESEKIWLLIRRLISGQIHMEQ